MFSADVKTNRRKCDTKCYINVSTLLYIITKIGFNFCLQSLLDASVRIPTCLSTYHGGLKTEGKTTLVAYTLTYVIKLIN